MYTCTSMYLNTHTGFMQGNSSTPLPALPPVWQLLTALCLSSSFSSNPAMLFRNWWSTTTSFLSGTPSMTVSGRRPHFAPSAFTSISVSKGFRWRLAWRVTDVCESTQHECENFPNWWLKTIIVLRIAACDGEHPDGSSAASKGSKGHPSVPVQLRLRPSTFAVATDMHTTTAEPFNFSCLKVKAPLREGQFWARVDRSSRSRRARRDSWRPRALQCMHILSYANQTFSNSYLAKTPSPLFVGNTDLKNFENYGRPLSEVSWTL